MVRTYRTDDGQYNYEIKSVISKITWVHFLREISCCYHGNLKRYMHRFPHQSVFTVRGQSYLLFLVKTTWILDLCYFTSKRTRLTRHKESTETHSDLNRPPQQWIKTHNHISRATFLQCYVRTYKNNVSPNITSAYRPKFRYRRC
jgi:hypothetical protein